MQKGEASASASTSSTPSASTCAKPSTTKNLPISPPPGLSLSTSTTSTCADLFDVLQKAKAELLGVGAMGVCSATSNCSSAVSTSAESECGKTSFDRDEKLLGSLTQSTLHGKAATLQREEDILRKEAAEVLRKADALRQEAAEAALAELAEAENKRAEQALASHLKAFPFEMGLDIPHGLKAGSYSAFDEK